VYGGVPTCVAIDFADLTASAAPGAMAIRRPRGNGRRSIFNSDHQPLITAVGPDDRPVSVS